MVSKRTSKLFILLGAILVALIFIVWQILWYMSWQKSDLIVNGVTVNGIDISGYNVASATQLAQSRLKDELQNKTINIVYEDITQSIHAKEFSHYDCCKTIENAFEATRSQYPILSYLNMVSAKLFGKEFKIDLNIDMDLLQAELNSKADAYYIAAQDAYIVSFDPNTQMGQRLSTVPHVVGRMLDISETAQSVNIALLSGQNAAMAHVTEAPANITQETLNSIDTSPVRSEFTFKDITADQENAILQVGSTGRYQIIYPGQELSIIEFLEAEDYIYSSMPDGGTGSDFEKALTKQIPTQIYIAALLAELDVIDRQMDKKGGDNLAAGIATVINQYYDMKLKNNLDFPVIVRIGYEKQARTSRIFCEIFRPKMAYATLLRSIIRSENDKTLVDIKRIYVDNKGNTIDSVLIEMIAMGANNDDD